MSPRHFLTSTSMMRNFVDARIVLMDRITVLASHFEYDDKVKHYFFLTFSFLFFMLSGLFSNLYFMAKTNKKKHIHKTLDSS